MYMPHRLIHLWERLISFPNLLSAAKKSARGKRFRPPVLQYHDQLEHELLRLQAALRDHTYCPGDYRTFYIHEPKKRLISAAPYRDRVVHHALVNVLDPIYERCFIYDSYACRKGKGTHAAVRRAQRRLVSRDAEALRSGARSAWSDNAGRAPLRRLRVAANQLACSTKNSRSSRRRTISSSGPASRFGVLIG
jgi:hypothetical protein